MKQSEDRIAELSDVKRSWNVSRETSRIEKGQDHEDHHRESAQAAGYHHQQNRTGSEGGKALYVSRTLTVYAAGGD